MHLVSLQPYLRLFQFGLDPTEVTEGGTLLSALQLALNVVRDRPSCALGPPLDHMDVAAHQLFSDDDTVPSVLHDRAMPRESLAFLDSRRNALHARFMRALIPAWSAHSRKVHVLLLSAAPDRLIPDLACIVLGLELDEE